MREYSAFQSIQSQIFGGTMYKQLNIGDQIPQSLASGGTAFQLVPGITRELAGDDFLGVHYAEQFFDVNVYYSCDNTHMLMWLNRDDITSLVPTVIRALEGYATITYAIDSFRLISIAPPAVHSPGSKVGVVTFHCAYAFRYI